MLALHSDDPISNPFLNSPIFNSKDFFLYFQSELKDAKKKLRSGEEEIKKLEAENLKLSSLLKDIQVTKLRRLPRRRQ